MIMGWGGSRLYQEGPNCCDEAATQRTCFTDFNPTFDQRVIEKRDSFIEEHATRFVKIRGNAQTFAYKERRPEDEYFAQWVETTLMIPDEPSKLPNTAFEVVEDREQGIVYVAYYDNKGDVGFNPPRFFGGFKDGGYLFIVHNQRPGGGFFVNKK